MLEHMLLLGFVVFFYLSYRSLVLFRRVMERHALESEYIRRCKAYSIAASQLMGRWHSAPVENSRQPLDHSSKQPPSSRNTEMFLQQSVLQNPRVVALGGRHLVFKSQCLHNVHSRRHCDRGIGGRVEGGSGVCDCETCKM
jgi:hypothetical protein